MCGIVGCAGNLWKNHYKFFRNALLLDVLRGQDSTGVMKVGLGPKTKAEVVKDIGHPMNLWDDFADNDWFDNRGVLKGHAKVLLGHNRATTMGATNVENAHPFNFDHITGVHNGTLWNTDDLLGDFDVDSKQVYYTISQKGIDYVWENLYGAAALVWWDEEAQRLNFIRNDQRPLCFQYTTGKKGLLWASEAWMLNIAAAKAEVKVDKVQDKEVLPKMFAADTLYSFEVTSVDVILRETRKLKKSVTRTTTITNVGGARVSTNHVVTGSTLRPKAEDRINTNWAGGMDRTDKSMRGLKAELLCGVNYFDSLAKKWVYQINGRLTNSNQRIILYPQTPAEYDKWASLIKEARDKDNEKIAVKLMSRPRIRVFKSEYVDDEFGIALDRVREVSRFPAYRAGFKTTQQATGGNVQQLFEAQKDETPAVTYPISGNVRVDEDSFHKELKGAGGCCANCDRTMVKEEADNIHWITRTVILCDDCSNNPHVMSLVGG